MITFPDIVRIYRRLELSVLTFFLLALIAFNSFFFRIRMSHENGAVFAAGLKIIDDPKFPPHDFFAAGAKFDCRVRFAAASFIDDAKMVVRAASLKFADARYDSPLDLMMNSGRTSLFWTAKMFAQFTWDTIRGHGKHFGEYCRRYPSSAECAADGVRRNPVSFAAMSYYTQTATGFIGTDGQRRYVRYRLVPKDYSGEDSGTVDAVDHSQPWLQNPYGDETRTRNYLKDELVERTGRDGEVHFRMQMQLRDWPDAVSPEFVSSGVIWSEVEFPWLDVADVAVSRPLDYEEAMLTRFHIGNHPPTLPVPAATSIDDYHSINHLRLYSTIPQRARLLAYKLRGMPPKFPDTRHSPDWTSMPPIPPPGP